MGKAEFWVDRESLRLTGPNGGESRLDRAEFGLDRDFCRLNRGEFGLNGTTSTLDRAEFGLERVEFNLDRAE